MKHNELNRLAAQSYDDTLAEGFNMRIYNLKRLILSCKDRKRTLKERESKTYDDSARDINQTKRRSIQFLIKEINTSMKPLAEEFKRTDDGADDDEVFQEKK